MARAGVQTGRSRHHQPHPPEGLRRGDHAAHRGDHEGAHQQLRGAGLHRDACPKPNWPQLAHEHESAVHRRSRQRHAGRSRALRAAARADAARNAGRTAPTSSPSAATSCSADRRPACWSGRRDLMARIAQNPMKRALRLDKLTLTALDAVLRLYLHPERLHEELPALRLLTRPADDIAAQATRVLPHVAAALGDAWRVEVSVPAKARSAAARCPWMPAQLRVWRSTPAAKKRAIVGELAAAFRALPVPVIGHIKDGAFVLDLRCLDHEDEFLAADQLRRSVREARGAMSASADSNDRRDRRSYRPRQDAAGQSADRHRHRPPAGGEGARHLDRPRLRLPAAGRMAA